MINNYSVESEYDFKFTIIENKRTDLARKQPTTLKFLCVSQVLKSRCQEILFKMILITQCCNVI